MNSDSVKPGFFSSQIWPVKGSFPKIRTVTVLFILTLIIRFFSAGILDNPRALDECCYYSVAVNLVETGSFTSQIKWTYIDGTEFPDPFPSNKFWMPAISILMALSIMLFNKTYLGARVLIIIVSSPFSCCSLSFFNIFFRDRKRRLAAWFLSMITPWYFLYWNTMDNFGLFGLAGFLGLVFFYLAVFFLKNSRVQAAVFSSLAGIFAGTAHLCRADGGLVIASGMIFYFLIFIMTLVRWRLPKEGDQEKKRKIMSLSSLIILSSAAVFFYLAVMGPWFYRNYRVFGQMLPKSAQNAVFLREYKQMFYYLNPPTAAESLKNGIMDFILTKRTDFSKIAVFMTAGHLFFFLIPFFAAAFIYYIIRIIKSLISCIRRADEFDSFFHMNPAVPQLIYFILSFTIISTLFSKAAVHGTLWHTSAAWIPVVTVISIQGFTIFHLALGRFFSKVGKPIQTCELIKKSRKVSCFTARVVCVGALALCIIYGHTFFKVWSDEYRVYEMSTDWISLQSARQGLPVKELNVPVISAAPGLTSYLSGLRTMQFPLDGHEAVMKAAKDHDARFIIGKEVDIKEIQGKYPERIENIKFFLNKKHRIATLELK